MPWVTSKSLWKTPQIGHWKNVEMDKTSDYSAIPFDRFDTPTEVVDEDNMYMIIFGRTRYPLATPSRNMCCLIMKVIMKLSLFSFKLSNAFYAME